MGGEGRSGKGYMKMIARICLVMNAGIEGMHFKSGGRILQVQKIHPAKGNKRDTPGQVDKMKLGKARKMEVSAKGN